MAFSYKNFAIAPWCYGPSWCYGPPYRDKLYNKRLWITELELFSKTKIFIPSSVKIG